MDNNPRTTKCWLEVLYQLYLLEVALTSKV